MIQNLSPMRWVYLESIDGILKFRNSPSNHNDVSAFGGELDGESTTHALRATSDEDSLEVTISSGHLHEEKGISSVTHSTLDGELVLATESEHFG